MECHSKFMATRFYRQTQPVYEVGNIVLMDETDIRSIYLICKVYQNIFYDEHFVAYSVDLGEKIKQINLIFPLRIPNNIFRILNLIFSLKRFGKIAFGSS